jgi:outer membrane protein assembly factor BamB
MKYWEIIVNKIIKAGFSVGWVSAFDDDGRTVWIVDADREGKRFVVHAGEKLTAFVELERAIYEFAVDSIS